MTREGLDGSKILYSLTGGVLGLLGALYFESIGSEPWVQAVLVHGAILSFSMGATHWVNGVIRESGQREDSNFS